MKYKEYVEKLEALEEDIDSGMLFELEEKPPLDLHSNIMKSIGNEKRRRSFMNYKIYVPAVAAVLLIVITLKGTGGIKGISSILNLLGNKPNTSEQVKDSGSQDANNTKYGISSAADQANDNQNLNTQPNSQGGTNQQNGDTQKKADVTSKEQTGSDSKGKSDSSGKETGIEGQQSGENGEVSITSITGENTSAGNTQDSTQNQSNGDGSTSTKQSQIRTMIAASDALINYEIVIKKSYDEIFDFLNNKENCEIVNEKDLIYKLSMENFKKLDEILSKLYVDKVIVTELVENSEFIFLKINIETE